MTLKEELAKLRREMEEEANWRAYHKIFPPTLIPGLTHVQVEIKDRLPSVVRKRYYKQIEVEA